MFNRGRRSYASNTRIETFKKWKTEEIISKKFKLIIPHTGFRSMISKMLLRISTDRPTVEHSIDTFNEIIPVTEREMYFNGRMIYRPTFEAKPINLQQADPYDMKFRRSKKHAKTDKSY